MRHLATGVAHNASLTSLWLFGNSVLDDGTAHLAAALRTSKLLNLGLEKNGLSHSGAEMLAYALTLDACTLSWLRLQHNPIGDHGVGALANSLRKNRSLTKLQLRDTGVGERGCSELSKALPYHAALKELGLEDVPGLRLTLTLILTLTLTPLQELGLEDNSLPPRATETLLRAMRQSSSLSSISLDLDHGGQLGREPAATLALLSPLIRRPSRRSQRISLSPSSLPPPSCRRLQQAADGECDDGQVHHRDACRKEAQHHQALARPWLYWRHSCPCPTAARGRGGGTSARTIAGNRCGSDGQSSTSGCYNRVGLKP